MKKRSQKSKIFNSINIILIALLFIEIISLANQDFTGNVVRKIAKSDLAKTPSTTQSNLPNNYISCSIEVCDSKDNDCDGSIDEGNVCKTSVIATTASQPSKQKEFTAFSNKYGGKWYVQEDETTKKPKQIYGSNIPVNSIQSRVSEINKDNAEEISKKFLRDNVALLGVNVDDLEKAQVFDDNVKSLGKRFVTAHLTQKYKEVPVEGSLVTLLFQNGELVSYRSSFQPNINIDVKPKITKEQAFEIAKTKELSSSKTSAMPKAEDLKIGKAILIIIPSSTIKNNPSPTLAWKIYFQLIQQLFSQPTYYIDAQSGDVLYRGESVQNFAKFEGVVRANVYPLDPDKSEGVSLGVPFVPVELCQKADPPGDQYYPACLENGLRLSTITDLDGYFKLEGDIDKSSPERYWLKIRSSVNRPTGSLFEYTGSVTGISENSFRLGSAPPYYINPFSSYPVAFLVPFNSLPLGDDCGDNCNLSNNNFDGTLKKEASNVYFHLRRATWFFNERDPPFDVVEEITRLHPGVDIGFKDITSEIGREVFGIVCSGGYASNLFDQSSSPVASISFTRSGSGSTNEGISVSCSDPLSLSSDVIYHEYAHHITTNIYFPIEMVGSSGLATLETKAMGEGYSDYWAATMTNSPIISEYGFETSSFYQSPNRNIMNNRRYPEDFYDESNEFDLPSQDQIHGILYTDSMIFSGALWDYRKMMVDKKGFSLGISWADEKIMLALKQKPVKFSSFLFSLVMVDSEHATEICDAFYTNHGICDSICESYGFPACPTSPPPPGSGPKASYKVPVDSGFIDSTTNFYDSLGTAGDRFRLYYKLIVGGVWNSDGVHLVGDGNTAITNNLLGNTSTNNLIDGCFYDGNLTVTNTTSGATSSQTVTFKKMPGIHDSMPRIVCISRTSGQGGDNDACETLAVVSDPKPAYYSMLANDWRKGRDALIISQSPLTQFQYSGDLLCDPNAGSQCAKDCWNIIGTNSNSNTGNDGLDNIFCIGASCSTSNPVSFAGCTTPALPGTESCYVNAVASLQAVYHKVIYYHWMDRDMNANGCDHDTPCLGEPFGSCPNQFGYDASPWALATFSQSNTCSEPRCERTLEGDPFDGFEDLPGFGISASDFSKLSRVGEAPVVNCPLCGCPTNAAKCNIADPNTVDNSFCENICTDANKNCLEHFPTNAAYDSYMDSSYNPDYSSSTLLVDSTHRSYVKFAGKFLTVSKVSKLNLYTISGSGSPTLSLYFLNSCERMWDSTSLTSGDWNRGALVTTFTPAPPGQWTSIDLPSYVRTGFCTSVEDSSNIFSVFQIRGDSANTYSFASSESTNKPSLDLWAVPKCSDGTLFNTCKNSGGASQYCENGILKQACSPKCSGSCPSGNICDPAGSGYCVPAPACYADSDCNDYNSCTVDTCSNRGQTNAYCSHVMRPNDCQVQECGWSPSGCFLCGPNNGHCAVGEACVGLGDCISCEKTCSSYCSCPTQGDVNSDYVIDVFDVIQEIAIAFSGGLDIQDPNCPTSRGDVNYDGGTDVFDMIYLIGTTFSSGVAPVNPCTSSPPASSSSSIISSTATASLGSVSGTTTKTVPVDFANTEAVAGATFKITYDPNQVSIKEIRKSPRTEKMELIKSGDTFTFIKSDLSQKIAAGSGAVAYIDVTSGKLGFDTSSLKITEVKAGNSKANKISVSIGSTTTVKKIIPSTDVNGETVLS